MLTQQFSTHFVYAMLDQIAIFISTASLNNIAEIATIIVAAIVLYDRFFSRGNRK